MVVSSPPKQTQAQIRAAQAAVNRQKRYDDAAAERERIRQERVREQARRDADKNARLAAADARAEAARLKRQQSKAQAQLDMDNRANGNMSTGRRKLVLVPALQNLGYSPQDALGIALDAPLNASMSNEQALRVALEYADSITPTGLKAQQDAAIAAGMPGANQMAAFQPTPIEMPDAARRALQGARFRATPGPIAARATRNGIGRQMGRFAAFMQPKLDRFANKPVPGGLGGLFFLNLVFLAVIVPANAQGYTRMQLLFLTLMNKTTFPGEVFTPETVPNSGLVAAGLAAAGAIQSAATSIASLGSDAGNVIGAIEAPGQAVQKAIGQNNPFLGGVIGAIGQDIGRLNLSHVVPNSASGANAPAPPPAPSSSGTTTIV